MDFLPVAYPHTESELMVMISLLEANGIHFYVRNQGFGSLYPGLQIDQYNGRWIMVRVDQAQDAAELLAAFRSQEVAQSDSDESDVI